MSGAAPRRGFHSTSSSSTCSSRGLAGGRALLATGTERPSGCHSYAHQRQTSTDLQYWTKG
jgi:hypothetical protein